MKSDYSLSDSVPLWAVLIQNKLCIENIYRSAPFGCSPFGDTVMKSACFCPWRGYVLGNEIDSKQNIMCRTGVTDLRFCEVK